MGLSLLRGIAKCDFA